MQKPDWINLLLVLTIIFLGVRLFSKGYSQIPKDRIAPLVADPAISDWGRNREFPPDFTEEEKIILTEQYHDYERTTLEMDKAYGRFLELLETYRSSRPELIVIPHKEDCFVRPVILTVTDGTELMITNNGDVAVDLGLDSESLTIKPGETVKHLLILTKDKEDQEIWGYSCSSKGLAGYFIKESD